MDTTTPAGELLANVMATVNQFERRVIAQRTRDALAGGRILRLRAKGWSYPRIPALFNKQDVRTAFGGRQWHPASIRAVALRAA